VPLQRVAQLQEGCVGSIPLGGAPWHSLQPQQQSLSTAGMVINLLTIAHANCAALVGVCSQGWELLQDLVKRKNRN
jgi:hypothetical protein